MLPFQPVRFHVFHLHLTSSGREIFWRSRVKGKAIKTGRKWAEATKTKRRLEIGSKKKNLRGIWKRRRKFADTFCVCVCGGGGGTREGNAVKKNIDLLTWLYFLSPPLRKVQKVEKEKKKKKRENLKKKTTAAVTAAWYRGVIQSLAMGCLVWL